MNILPPRQASFMPCTLCNMLLMDHSSVVSLFCPGSKPASYITHSRHIINVTEDISIYGAKEGTSQKLEKILLKYVGQSYCQVVGKTLLPLTFLKPLVIYVQIPWLFAKILFSWTSFIASDSLRVKFSQPHYTWYSKCLQCLLPVQYLHQKNFPASRDISV